MDEYIKRSVLIEALNQVTNDPTCPLNIAADVYQVATEIPAADARLERHGEWLWINDGFYECSECGAYTDAHRPYCWKCGAKMKMPDTET